jgi:hypothetical protein
MKKIIVTTASMALVLAILVGSVFLLLKVGSIFAAASDTIKAASIASLGSVLLFLLGRYFEQRREATQRINKEKIEIYKTFFDFYFDIMSYEKIHGEAKDTKIVMSEMLEFQKQILFWGSDKVIKDYLDFKDALIGFSDGRSEGDQANLHIGLAKTMTAVAKVLVSMRRDIGYSFTSFTAKDLARLQLATGADTKPVIDLLD